MNDITRAYLAGIGNELNHIWNTLQEIEFAERLKEEPILGGAPIKGISSSPRIKHSSQISSAMDNIQYALDDLRMIYQEMTDDKFAFTYEVEGPIKNA